MSIVGPLVPRYGIWCVQEQIQLTKALSEPLSQLQQTAHNIAEISQECKLPVEPDEYMESFKPFSMDITYHWSKVCCPALHTIAAIMMITILFVIMTIKATVIIMIVTIISTQQQQ